MAIIDDYAGIAGELRRIRAEREPEPGPAEAPRDADAPGEMRHPMRATAAGDQLYRRLVTRRRGR